MFFRLPPWGRSHRYWRISVLSLGRASAKRYNPAPITFRQLGARGAVYPWYCYVEGSGWPTYFSLCSSSTSSLIFLNGSFDFDSLPHELIAHGLEILHDFDIITWRSQMLGEKKALLRLSEKVLRGSHCCDHMSLAHKWCLADCKGSSLQFKEATVRHFDCQIFKVHRGNWHFGAGANFYDLGRDLQPRLGSNPPLLNVRLLALSRDPATSAIWSLSGT